MNNFMQDAYDIIDQPSTETTNVNIDSSCDDKNREVWTHNRIQPLFGDKDQTQLTLYLTFVVHFDTFFPE